MSLIEQIISLAEELGYTIDRMDLGCTLYVAMSAPEQDDLEAMLHYSLESDMDKAEIWANVIHDLNGCKARHLKLPEGVCFLPRSHNYAKAV